MPAKGHRQERAARDVYAEDSEIKKAMDTLVYRAETCLETKGVIAQLESTLAAEREGLIAEGKLFNEAREKVLKLCPEVATGFLQAGETMKVVDGKLVIVPVMP